MRTSLSLLFAASSLLACSTTAAAAPPMPSYCEKDTYPTDKDTAAVYDSLMKGVATGDVAAVTDALTAHHVNVNARYLSDGFCYIPLVLAVERYQSRSGLKVNEQVLPMVDLLLDHGADPNVYDYPGLTPLQYAVQQHSPELAQALIAHGADLNAVSQGGSTQTALQQAMTAIPADKQMVAVLLKAGASARDVNIVDVRPNDSPESLELVKLLIAHGVDVNAQWHGFYAELNIAAEAGYVDLTRLLLENGATADLRLHGRANETPLLMAAEQFEKLNQAGSPPRNSPPDERHAKHIKRPIAPGPGGGDPYATIVEMLIAHHADVNAKDVLGKTPLHDSVDSEDPRIVDMLIKAGADVNVVDHSGRTPLDYATTVPVATLLLAHGAKLAGPERDALGNAIWAGRADMVSFLIASGADVNAADDQKQTPLHVAAYTDKREIAEILLSHGAKVDAVSNFPGINGTPLQVALTYKHMDVAKLLVDRGATYKGLLGALSDSDIQALLGPQRAADYLRSRDDHGKPQTN